MHKRPAESLVPGDGLPLYRSSRRIGHQVWATLLLGRQLIEAVKQLHVLSGLGRGWPIPNQNRLQLFVLAGQAIADRRLDLMAAA
jgi:hypothetical protein